MSKNSKSVTELRSYYLSPEFPVLLLTGDIWRISDRVSPNLHFHNCLEIGFCHEGSGILRIQQADHPFCAGNISVIARYIPHTTFSAPGTASKWSYLMLDLSEMFDHFMVPWEQELVNQSMNFVGILKSEQYPTIRDLVLNLIREIHEEKAYYQTYARSLFLSLAIELNRILETHEEFLSSPDDAANRHALSILPALEFMKQNYMNPFPMEHLAKICGLSPTHFRRVFNEAMGAAPLEYLNTLRINKACHLLKSTDDSIIDISEAVGFHSISTFNRCFSRLTNMSPRIYRRTLPEDDLKDTRIMKFNGWMQPD